MFTGLVEQVGTIERVERAEAGRTFRIACGLEALENGESIAVNGACLTVRTHGSGWFECAAVVTTLDRTTIDDWSVGRRVNLERAMRLGDRLGGHLVQGHVDGVASVRGVAQLADARLVDLAVAPVVAELIVPHGSLAVDGVSLTVNALPEPEVVQVSLIEHTLRHTTLGALLPGDRVHVEGDLIGKYVRRLLAPYTGALRAGA
ncbi:MAG TPA: riboflavin synthase [Gemmatimonadaceae bacterium]|nr:riboflavin synthase [Gemmatimonadaceae bacterium]